MKRARAGIFFIIMAMFFYAACDTGTGNSNSDPKPPETYTITVNRGGVFENGSISVKDGLLKAAENDTVTIIATPVNEEYYLERLTVRGAESNEIVNVSTVPGKNNERTFTMPGEDVIVAAVFATDVVLYRFTVNRQYKNGDITLFGGGKVIDVKEGTPVILDILPAEGYYLAYLTILEQGTGELFPLSTELVPGLKTITITMPAKNLRIPEGSKPNVMDDGAVFLPIEE